MPRIWPGQHPRSCAIQQSVDPPCLHFIACGHLQTLAEEKAAEEAAKRAAPVPLAGRLLLLVLALLYVLFAYRIEQVGWGRDMVTHWVLRRRRRLLLLAVLGCEQRQGELSDRPRCSSAACSCVQEAH